MRAKNKIGIATVFFNPTPDSLEFYNKFVADGYCVAIGNNGIDEQDLKSLSKKILVVGDGVNVGLAKAMNEAVSALFESSDDIDSVMLFDQDSRPSVSLPIDMYISYFTRCEHNNVACLGPMLIDEKTNIKHKKDEFRYKQVSSVATSGTFITREKFQIVGPLKEEFFIDCLDHEWCFRAKNMGFQILIDSHLTMAHNMGEDGLDWFGTFKPIYRSPIRHYYIVRNTLAMIATSYAPPSWRIIESFKLVRRIVFYILFSKNRRETISKIIEAFRYFVKS